MLNAKEKYFELREIINNKGYLGGVRCTLIKKNKSSIFRTSIDFGPQISKEWRITIESGVSIFMDHFAKYNTEEVGLNFTEVKILPVNTTHSIMIYATVMVLGQLLEYDSSKVMTLDMNTGNFIVMG